MKSSTPNFLKIFAPSPASCSAFTFPINLSGKASNVFGVKPAKASCESFPKPPRVISETTSFGRALNCSPVKPENALSESRVKSSTSKFLTTCTSSPESCSAFTFPMKSSGKASNVSGLKPAKAPCESSSKPFGSNSPKNSSGKAAIWSCWKPPNTSSSSASNCSKLRAPTASPGRKAN